MNDDSTYTMQFTDLDPTTRGRINGLLEAATTLTEQRVKHHDDMLDDDRENVRRHHQSCHNTCNNMAMAIHKQAINLALTEASHE